MEYISLFNKEARKYILLIEIDRTYALRKD
jgi:hypothetical protein